MSAMKVFKKPPKLKNRDLRPMSYQETWEWGYCEAMEVACQWLEMNGITKSTQDVFRGLMAHRGNQISNVTFQRGGYGQKERWT